MSKTVVDLISLWLPFLILIGVWIFFMNRMRGGSSWQNKCLEVMKAQTESQAAIARSLERIATALEQKQP
jgi:ATP-dependent Zn protease